MAIFSFAINYKEKRNFYAEIRNAILDVENKFISCDIKLNQTSIIILTIKEKKAYSISKKFFFLYF